MKSCSKLESLQFSMMFLQRNRRDVANFDAEFTREEPALTPVNAEVLQSINQDEFRGFTFVNSDYNPSRFVAD